jgi:hypothetical protein
VTALWQIEGTTFTVEGEPVCPACAMEAAEDGVEVGLAEGEAVCVVCEEREAETARGLRHLDTNAGRAIDVSLHEQERGRHQQGESHHVVAQRTQRPYKDQRQIGQGGQASATASPRGRPDPAIEFVQHSGGHRCSHAPQGPPDWCAPITCAETELFGRPPDPEREIETEGSNGDQVEMPKRQGAREDRPTVWGLLVDQEGDWLVRVGRVVHCLGHHTNETDLSPCRAEGDRSARGGSRGDSLS